MYLGNPRLEHTWLKGHAFRAAALDEHNRYQMFNVTRRDKDPVADNIFPIVHYLRDRGFISDLGGAYSLLPTSGGTTRAYDLVIEQLASDVNKWNAARRKKIKPAIIMPTPTYGFFFKPIEDREIEIVKVPRDLENGGRLDLNLLDQTIKSINAQGKRVIGYYDSNPNNPLGLVRGEEETRAIAAILDRHSDAYEEADRQKLIRSHGHRVAYRRQWDGPTSRICKIDDMVYDGLEYGDTKPFSFGQIEGAERDTFVLLGTSKAGFVTARAGLIVGPESTIQKMAQQAIYNDYFPQPLVIHALSGHMNLGKAHVRARTNHFRQMNQQHALCGKFMKAAINGIGNVQEITGPEADLLAQMVGAGTSLKKSGIKAWLEKGTQGVKVITSPQSGFFHLLDFGSLKAPVSEVKLDFEYGENVVNAALERVANIRFATGGYTGLDPEAIILRATYACPPETIIALTERLRDFMHQPAPKLKRDYYPL
jgi:aspartate/methionine/tyrosine aminotransferase